MDRIEEIRERLAKITPWPWRVHSRASTAVESPSIDNVIAACGGWADYTRDVLPEQQGNTAFIAAAPEDVAFLLSQLEQAKRLLVQGVAMQNEEGHVSDGSDEDDCENCDWASRTEAFLNQK